MNPRYANPLVAAPTRPLPRRVAVIGAGSIGPDIGYYLKSALPGIELTLVDVAQPAIDAALTERQIKTRIVFLIYYDLLWPPEQIKLNNPDRFVLMFAPYTRSYSEPYSANSAGAEIPPYVRNKIEMPTTGDGTVAFLRAW